MNTFSVNPLRLIVRFILATAAACFAELIVGMILSPLSPIQAKADPAFFRLLVGSSMMIGGAMIFMIENSRFHGLKLLGLTLMAYVGAAQVQQHVEMVLFNFTFNFTTQEIIFIILSQALMALIFVPLVITIAGKWKAPSSAVEDRTGAFSLAPLRSLILRLVILSVLWYMCYMLSGLFVADPVTHEYYMTMNPQLAEMNALLFIVQLFRGLLWVALIVLGIRIMNRPIQESGLLIGLFYGIFHAATLLLPNEFMPLMIRLAHLPEIILSLTLFACICVPVLLYRKKEIPG